MKNFKKVLALVLAIATLLSFATVASAKTADFADAKDVKNTEAVDVLSYIKVLEGYPADNTFKPAKNITREEAAKIIAIFANKSTDISSLYTSANPFADMKGRWGESYVAYGYRAGIIAGKNATSFVPKANVKGTEFLKMVLVVLGYDQNKEGLVGSSWAVNTLELAKAKKLLTGLGKDFDANAALTRDQAAQIMLNALKAEKVVYGQTITNLTWNAKTGYWMTTNTASNAVYVSPNGAVNNYEHKLLAADFGLTLKDTEDEWGRPTHTWLKGTTTIKEYKNTDKLLKSYQTAVFECDVAKDCGFTKDTVLPLFLNGKENKVNDTIRPLATTTKIGAQGRLTEVYEDRIVMIDTFLAKVTAVKKATFDANGHMSAQARIDMYVYTADTATAKVPATGANYTLFSDTNYDYAVGDYILVNAKMNTTRVTALRTQSCTSLKYATNANPATTAAYGEIVGKAESFEGAQTIIWSNADQHTVDGTTYSDALEFHLDEAGTKTGKYTWFKDQYGNLIGDVVVETAYTYGVITKLFYAGTVENGAGIGSGKYLATVKYMDGTENTVEVKSIALTANGRSTVEKYSPKYANAFNSNMTFDTTNKVVYISADYGTNTTSDYSNEDVIDGHLFKMSTDADGKVAFERVETQLAAGVKVTNKSGYIVGSATTGATTQFIPVDVNTKFLYVTPLKNGSFNMQGTYEYKTADGILNIPTFDKNVKVDYVLGSNDVAQYVYIIGETADSKVKSFVFGDNTQLAAYVKNDAVEYYQVELPTVAEDGAKETVKTLSGQIAAVLTSTEAHGKLFYVETTNGYVTKVTEIPYVGQQTETDTSKRAKVYSCDTAGKNFTSAEVVVDGEGRFVVDAANGIYANMIKNGAKVFGDVIQSKDAGSSRYTFDDASQVIVGDKAELLASGETDKIIYVIFQQKDIEKVAQKIYVTSKKASDKGPYEDPWQADARGYQVNLTEKKILPNNLNLTVAELEALWTSTGSTATASGTYKVTSVDSHGVSHEITVDASQSAYKDVKFATFIENKADLKVTVNGVVYTVVLAK